MRYIDIYKADAHSGSGYLLIAQDCIQLASADVTRKPNAKTFIMADGSICVYTAVNDAVEMTLSLECTERQAKNIADNVRRSRLYFAGLRAGADSSPTPTDKNYFSAQKKLFEGYLTENSSVKVQQISADLFSLQIPLKLAVGDGSLKKFDFPTIQISELSLFGNNEEFSGYAYRKGDFCRKNVIFTDEAEAEINFTYSGTVDGLKARLINERLKTAMIWDPVEAENSGAVPLTAGVNTCTLLLYTENNAYKQLRIQFMIYRQPPIS